MIATNIKWDVDFEEDGKYLPTEIEIPPEITDEEEISNYLSEVTGFCHNGFELVHPKDMFKYHGFHFIPQEHTCDELPCLHSITLHLKSDYNLGFSNYEWGKIKYSYDDFYAAHGYKVNNEYYYDLFLCEETGKKYIPGEHELFEWVENPETNTKKQCNDTNPGNKIVKFVDIHEENNMTPHYGILLPNKTIICFCCGGIVQPKEYVILDDKIAWQYLDETTREYL